jgi:hypothetical protein
MTAVMTRGAVVMMRMLTVMLLGICIYILKDAGNRGVLRGCLRALGISNDLFFSH